MKYFLLFVLLGCASKEHEDTCGEWVSQASRTQAGEWIWFPGSGTDVNKGKAILEAEGAALNYLYGECQSIPSDVKFHERCIKREGRNFVIHTRASVRSLGCNKMSPSNRELVLRLISYRASIAKLQIDTNQCNPNNPEQCYLLAFKEKNLKNLEKALAYAEAGCLYGEFYTCGFLGFTHWELGNVQEARHYLEIGCKQDPENNWCNNLKELEDQILKFSAGK